MRINKLILSFLVITFGWLVCVTAYAGSASDPVGMLQYIANNMIAGLKKNEATLKTKPQVVYSLAHKYVVPYADVAEMSKRVLPPAVWRTATPSQRVEFQNAFTTTLIRTYASALTNYQDQSVQFYPVRGGYQGLSTVEVSSEITGSQTQPIHVSYRMARSGNTWKLFDMSVEGVSMLDSFRAQFEDLLEHGNMSMLLQRLAEHNSGVNR